MDAFYLQELIEQANIRGGGLILNFQDKPAVVVLTIDKYNSLLEGKQALVSAEFSMKNDTLNLTAKKYKQKTKKVLVTGGAGYIGAHLVRQLLKADLDVVVFDNLSTGRKENLSGDAVFVEGDLADLNLLRDLFLSSNFDAVFHMAASIEVEESVRDPQKYFFNNVLNTANLLKAMDEAGCKNIIFSSTAAVYGEQAETPIAESAVTKPNNPYGATKLLAEKLIEYYCNFVGFKAVIFRYFNACGCDFDGQILPTHESHLIPIVVQVATGLRRQITVNGNDYETFDGTCVRDYVHVLDIAKAHLAALENIELGKNFRVYNVGTGKGLSVAQIINGAAEVLNRIIPMEIGPRRAGDAPVTIADNSKLTKEFGFIPEHSDLETIINTSWNQMNMHKP